MANTCVVGLQWGDEAKGKIVDLLCDVHDVVVRYQGGANAGHTVVSGNDTWKLSLIPSGILRDGVTCVVTGGVVLDPRSVLAEIDGLESRGVRVTGKLLLSDRAHVVFPWHVREDQILDKTVSGGEAIGTTGRGIGPCYRDKVGRSMAIRLGDLFRKDFPERLAHVVSLKQRLLESLTASTLTVSSVTLGLALIITFDTPPLDLRSWWLITPIAHVLVALPIAVRTITPVVASIPAGLSHAAATLGASPFTRLPSLPRCSSTPAHYRTWGQLVADRGLAPRADGRITVLL